MSCKAKNKAKRLGDLSKVPYDISLCRTIKNKLKFAIHSAKLDYIKSFLSCSHQTPQFAATFMVGDKQYYWSRSVV